MPGKKCEVCGGSVSLIADRGSFGACSMCGLVYYLKESTPLGGGPPEASGPVWRCPDCDAEVKAESEGDLRFVVREHIRSYHPNRSAD